MFEENPAMKKPIKIFNSFEEQKAEEIKEMLALTPQERIKHAVDRTLRAYGTTREALKKRKRNKEIKIIYYGERWV